jgi:RNA methyltransferase, TrmH family
MTVRLLTSKDNPLLKTIRLVAAQSRRAPADLVLAEGIRVVEEAVRTGHTIEAVLVSEQFGDGPREGAMLESIESGHVHVGRVAGSLFRTISDVVTPQGIVALVRLPRRALPDIEVPPNPLALVACGIQDPGNLGTLIRSAAAAGAAFVCTTRSTVSVRNPKCVRSTAGTLFRIPLVENVTPQAIVEHCSAWGIQLHRSAAGEGTDFTLADLRAPTGILLGNESQGLRAREWAAIPSLKIPMAAGVESLNVAAAGAILLFEARRQRMEEEARIPLHPLSDRRRS